MRRAPPGAGLFRVAASARERQGCADQCEKRAAATVETLAAALQPRPDPERQARQQILHQEFHCREGR